MLLITLTVVSNDLQDQSSEGAGKVQTVGSSEKLDIHLMSVLRS